MLRASLVEDTSVSEASRQFGYSRESFYNAVEAFRDRGVLGLADEKRGPKEPRKLTRRVQDFILDRIETDSSVSGRDLAEQIHRELVATLH